MSPLTITEQKEIVHLALAKPNTNHQELKQRKIGYFIMNGATQETRKLMFKSPKSSMACMLQILWGKITRHRGVQG